MNRNRMCYVLHTNQSQVLPVLTFWNFLNENLYDTEMDYYLECCHKDNKGSQISRFNPDMNFYLVDKTKKNEPIVPFTHLISF